MSSALDGAINQMELLAQELHSAMLTLDNIILAYELDGNTCELEDAIQEARKVIEGYNNRKRVSNYCPNCGAWPVIWETPGAPGYALIGNSSVKAVCSRCKK